MRIRGFLVRQDGTLETCREWNFLDFPDFAGRRFLYLDLEGEIDPGEGEKLSSALGWHPVILDNFLQKSSRPKLINFEHESLITLHAVNILAIRQRENKTVEIDAVLSRNLLVTYHRLPVSSIDESLAEACALPKARDSADLLLYHIVSRIVDKYEPLIDERAEEAESLEEEALHDPSPDLLDRIVISRDEIIALQRVLSPQMLLISQLALGESRFIRPYVRLFFKDAENRFRNTIDELASFKEIIANSLELFRSTQSQRTNQSMRVLTAISTLLLPLTFITGLYGMNVPLPGQDRAQAFFVLMFLCLAVFGSMLLYMRRKGWF